jgi:dipeptidyl aminopeptidase/acylaminoacyl peptidase
MFRRAFTVVVIGLASSAAAAGRPIAPADLLAMARLSDPQISPDGSRVLYTVAVPDMKANRLVRDVWMVTIATGSARNLTNNGRDGGARWSPDGRTIAFVSTRDKGAQLYVMDSDGGGVKPLTAISGGVDNIVWAPDGQALAFTSEAFADCRDEPCNARRTEERDKNPVQAHVAERLLFRHWTSWTDTTRSHLFVLPAAGGAARDLTVGADYDVPPREREGPHPIAFAPDGKTICFTAVTEPMEATSTNADLFEIDIAGGTPKRVTTGPGFDGSPAYSPDGRWIAYRSQAKAGYEADKWRLMLLDRGTGRSTSVIDGFDRSVDTALWSKDGTTIFFNAEDRGEMPIFSLPFPGGPPANATPRAVTPGMFDGEFQLQADGSLVVSRSSLAAPAELFIVDRAGTARALTRHNATLVSALDVAKGDAFTFKSSGSTDIQGFLVRPPAFDPSKKYPVLLLLHGGPQTQWGDTWSYRWNAQAFAAPGYVVVMINRRGSTGFGQKFTDEIQGDWGGKPFDDLMTGLEFVLGKYTFTDRERVAAAGASYGGYMIDWMASQSNGRFKALVSHAGVYDLTSMYATEELWFVEHDFGGTPWSNPAMYQKLSPHSHAADFGKFKTPTLVIAGELDFRVPYTQSLEFYSALQRQGVPSKLVVFPDEGHWILKPQNSAFWYGQVLDWLARYLQPEASSQKSPR